MNNDETRAVDTKIFVLNVSGNIVEVYQRDGWWVAPVWFKPVSGRYSQALCNKLENLHRKYGREIRRYAADQTPNWWGFYPESRATIEYLQKKRLLRFRGRKIEVEDVGPPFKQPPKEVRDIKFPRGVVE